MKKLCKLCLVFFVVLTVVSVMQLGVFAEDPEHIEDPSIEAWMRTVTETIESHVHTNVSVIYTDDSTASGVTAVSDIDVLEKQLYLVLTPDLPFGHVIYDSPETDYIDGIRINGRTITSLRVPIDYTEDTDYEIVVRTVYADDFTGRLAQISDGTFNWWSLLANPVGLLIAIYYTVAIVSVIVGFTSAARGKSKQIKTADDLCNSANLTAEQVIDAKVVPIMLQCKNMSQALVKAMILTTSKSKGASSDLIDVLSNVADMDVEGIVSETKKSIEDAQLSHDRAKADTLATLKKLATNQEVPNEHEGSESEPSIF